jgi:hypothetical protein
MALGEQPFRSEGRRNRAPTVEAIQVDLAPSEERK